LREEKGREIKVNEYLFPLFGNIKWKGRKGNGKKYFTLIFPHSSHLIHSQNEGKKGSERFLIVFPSFFLYLLS